MPVSLIRGKCFVMLSRDYFKLKPVGMNANMTLFLEMRFYNLIVILVEVLKLAEPAAPATNLVKIVCNYIRVRSVDFNTNRCSSEQTITYAFKTIVFTKKERKKKLLIWQGSINIDSDRLTD